MTDARPINAVIAVRRDGPRTWYVRRSMEMANYPGVWSLPSIQFDPALVTDATATDAVQPLMTALSAERLGGVGVTATGHVTSGRSDQNPMGVEVTLHLHEVAFAGEPRPDSRYYVDAAWMDAAQYEEASRGQPCGLCTRLWGDHAWAMGWADRPFVSHLDEAHAVLARLSPDETAMLLRAERDRHLGAADLAGGAHGQRFTHFARRHPYLFERIFSPSASTYRRSDLGQRVANAALEGR